MGWQRYSSDWYAFVEGPEPQDADRLLAHLGLEWYDPEYEPHAVELATELDHPGIAFYKLHALRLSHAVYEPHVRYLRGLPQEYFWFDPNPEFFRIAVDIRQRPHTYPRR
jgi:hypothetical protein